MQITHHATAVAHHFYQAQTTDGVDGKRGGHRLFIHKFPSHSPGTGEVQVGMRPSDLELITFESVSSIQPYFGELKLIGQIEDPCFEAVSYSMALEFQELSQELRWSDLSCEGLAQTLRTRVGENVTIGLDDEEHPASLLISSASEGDLVLAFKELQRLMPEVPLEAANFSVVSAGQQSSNA